LEPGYIVGFDSGTQSVKTIVCDKEGRRVGQAREEHAVHCPIQGWAEQNPEDWWKAFCISLERALHDAGISSSEVEAIAMAHQRSTLAIVDEDCRSLLPAQVWHDSRSTEQVRWINEQFGGERYMNITGCMPDVTWWGPKIMWVRDHESDIFKKAYKFLTVHGFFVRKLTGEWKDSRAAPSGVLDMARLDYSNTLLDALGIPREKLCDLISPGEVIGYISKDTARETSLPVGVPVAAGAGDQQSGGLGCGVVDSNTAYLNLGTSVVVGTSSRKYVPHRNLIIRAGAIPGTWNPEALLSSGYWMITWLKENFAVREVEAAKKKAIPPEEILDAAAEKLQAGSSGLILQPYWLGVRQPYWDQDARGTIIGWTSSHRREHLYRATIEGIAYDIRLNLTGIEQILGSSIEQIRIHGGGAKSKFSCQIVADVLNRSVSTIRTVEATAQGAVALAATAIGLYPKVEDAATSMAKIETTFEPIEKNASLYEAFYQEVYAKLYETVRPLLRKITQIDVTSKRSGQTVE
jgi:xylulokinase